MASVVFDNVSIQYPGAEEPSVAHLDLKIDDGEFLVLVGPSGCGKSTTLRALAGLEAISDGQIRIGDKDVTGTEPKDRDVAMVFQNYALYPHMTVEKNMGFALTMAKKDKAEIKHRVAEAAEILDLTEFLDRKPKQLSGGQRQRVAMGRAIVREPQVFLMDEPLSNLDAKLRVQTRTQVAQLQRRLGVTTVYVTHDQVEAMTMGDRVAVLNKGVLQQVDSPRELYDHPINSFVAGFIGSPAMNLLTLPCENGRPLIGGQPMDIEVSNERTQITLGIRPEHCTVVAEETVEELPGTRVHATVDIVEELGSDAFVYTSLNSGEGEMVSRLGEDVPKVGDQVEIALDSSRIHLFDAETGLRVES